MKLPAFDVPIVLAPMGGVATVDLVVAVAEAGGFPILPGAYLTPEQIVEQAAAVRRATRKPFGINLFVEHPPYAADPDVIAHVHARLGAFRGELGIEQPAVTATPPDRYAAQIDAVIEARPDAFTFTFGIPDARTLARFEAAGTFTMGTATTVDEALALADACVDGVFAQGSEAGAHRGTFLAPVADSLVGTLALVPQVVDAVRLPVFAAGGIGDGRGVAAVLALGATAAAVGTSFLLAHESGIAPAYRAVLKSARVRATVLTRTFSGRTARGVANRVTQTLRDPEDVAPYPFHNAMTRDIRNAAAQAGNAEYLSLWAGQAASLAREAPAGEIVRALMEEARRARDAIRLDGPRSGPA
jgi:nitronate monooxygenase